MAQEPSLLPDRLLETLGGLALEDRFPRAPLAAVAVVVVLAVVHAMAPVTLVQSAPLDIFVPLDGGWRWMQGQTPHLDYPTPVGFLWYWMYGVTMALDGGSAHALRYVPALNGVVLAVLTAWVVRGRMPGLMGAVATLLAGAVTVSPADLDVLEISHMASYNRIGWALTSLVCLMMLRAPPQRSQGRTLAEGAVLVAVLWWLFFLKITYFAMAGAVMIVAALFVAENRRLAVAGGVLVWAGLGLAWGLSPLPAAYLGDILASLAAVPDQGQRGGVLPFQQTFDTVYFNFPPLLVTIFAALWLARSDPDEGSDPTPLALLAVVLLLVPVGSQTHEDQAPTAGALALASLGLLGARAELLGPSRQRGLGWLVGLLSVWLLPVVVFHSAAVVLHYSSAADPSRHVPIVSSADERVSSLRFGVRDEDQPFVTLVQDGRLDVAVADVLPFQWDGGQLQLVFDDSLVVLERDAPGRTRIMSMGFSSPFPWLLERPPPRQVPQWIDVGRTIGGGTPFSVEQHLSDSDVVLYSKLLGNVELDTLYDEHAHDALVRAGWRVVESPVWTVWLPPEP